MQSLGVEMWFMSSELLVNNEALYSNPFDWLLHDEAFALPAFEQQPAFQPLRGMALSECLAHPPRGNNGRR